jgi:hypothetical protein
MCWISEGIVCVARLKLPDSLTMHTVHAQPTTCRLVAWLYGVVLMADQ